MKISLFIRLGVVALGTGIVAASLGIGAQAPPKKIRVIYTTDTQGLVQPCG